MEIPTMLTVEGDTSDIGSSPRGTKKSNMPDPCCPYQQTSGDSQSSLKLIRMMVDHAEIGKNC